MKDFALRNYPAFGITTDGTPTDTLVPELWAWEILRQLKPRMGVLDKVNRSYDTTVASMGEIVHLNRPGTFKAQQKLSGQPIVMQTATTEKDTLRLNQHIHVSYPMEDRVCTASALELVQYFMIPAARAIIERANAITMGEVYQFLPTAAGYRGMTDSYADAEVRSLREKFQRNNVPFESRNLFVGPHTDNLVSGIAQATEYQMRGPQGDSPLMTGRTRALRGYNIVEDSFCPEVSENAEDNTMLVNEATGYLKGATTIKVNTSTFIVTTGQWCIIAGDGIPRRIVAHTETQTATTEIVLETGLAKAVANDAIVTIAPKFTVSGGSYAADYISKIKVSALPQIGSGVSFSGVAGSPIYSVVDTLTDGGDYYIYLNRPLEASVANGSGFLLPNANYNLACTPDAIIFVNRPMKLPRRTVDAFVATDPEMGMSIRVTMGYSMEYMQDMITIDTLCGVLTVDPKFGGVLIG